MVIAAVALHDLPCLRSLGLRVHYKFKCSGAGCEQPVLATPKGTTLRCWRRHDVPCAPPMTHAPCYPFVVEQSALAGRSEGKLVFVMHDCMLPINRRQVLQHVKTYNGLPVNDGSICAHTSADMGTLSMPQQHTIPLSPVIIIPKEATTQLFQHGINGDHQHDLKREAVYYSDTEDNYSDSYRDAFQEICLGEPALYFGSEMTRVYLVQDSAVAEQSAVQQYEIIDHGKPVRVPPLASPRYDPDLPGHASTQVLDLN